jgi:hypothetical protein
VANDRGSRVGQLALTHTAEKEPDGKKHGVNAQETTVKQLWKKLVEKNKAVGYRD